MGGVEEGHFHSYYHRSFPTQQNDHLDGFTSLATFPWLAVGAESVWILAVFSIARKSCSPHGTEGLNPCGHGAWRESQLVKSKTMKQSSDESLSSSSSSSPLVLPILPSSFPYLLSKIHSAASYREQRHLYQNQRRPSVGSD